jgi:hypothetical protein
LDQYTDPATGRPYTIDQATGQPRWVDAPTPPRRPPARKPHRARNTIIGIGCGCLALGLFGAAIGDNDSQAGATPAGGAAGPAASTNTQPARPHAKAPKMPGIGTPVRDGKFQFTVLKIQAGSKRVGSEYLGKNAQGQYVLVTIRVENIGDHTQMFAGSSQKATDTQGRTLDADSEAAIYLGEQSKSLLTDINPGNTVTGVVVWDIPKGARLASLELHDSPFSGGVEVALT